MHLELLSDNGTFQRWDWLILVEGLQNVDNFSNFLQHDADSAAPYSWS